VDKVLPLRILFQFFSGRTRTSLHRVYEKSKFARVLFISFALLSQLLALLVTGMIGVLLGMFVRSFLS
jgi:hypothetical protein